MSSSIEAIVAGVLQGDRASLAQGITLVESTLDRDRERAKHLLETIMPKTGGSLRIGITGIPGAGKSTLIDVLGTALCAQGKKLAVLAIDPSSARFGGSILGDKTRMERLAKEEKCFIRPSPSRGALGGVAHRTLESCLLCEAAGYDVVIIETMGVGQGEHIVRDLVDLFILLVVTGTGDELQGVKRGIMELADIVVVTKADGDNLPVATALKRQLEDIMLLFESVTQGWQATVLTVSALKGEGIESLWQKAEEFYTLGRSAGFIVARRGAQQVRWMHRLIEEELYRRFKNAPGVDALYSSIIGEVEAGSILPQVAAARLLEKI